MPPLGCRKWASILRILIVNDDGITIDVRWPDAPPVFAPTDTGLFQAIEQACLAHMRVSTPVPSICPGGTDARFFTAG